ncbi:MAG: 3-phosphoshikimate 1-carboxyvinyltransferase [Dehalococcoidia bacterium]|nr:MAG: 3-phosphoshikimate 1-carboxyvinyltransferase [Dehalococcoidia bacterium]
MKVFIEKSEPEGSLIAPPSKSYTIRALMGAALAKGESEIIHPLISDDTGAARAVLGKIGVNISPQKDNWRVSGGSFREAEGELFCGESAATLRFMTAICSLVPGKCRLTAAPSLARRPIEPLIRALRQLGVNASHQGETAPITVKGGELRGGTVELTGDISSQFVSALLFIAPFTEDGLSIKLTTPLQSKPFVLMTIDCLSRFGIKTGFSKELDEFKISRQAYQPAKYEIEGDWSSASYFLALGAISGGIEVDNLNPESLQGDKIMLNFLPDMGAQVTVNPDSVILKKSSLKAIRADLADCIDLLPTMAILAAVAEGTSELTGIERAVIKESNRVAAVKEGLERMGIAVNETSNKLTITGSVPQGALIDSRGDHRIAMAFSLLGSLAGDTIIDGAECVAKTFPDFWDKLESLGGRVKINGQ